MTKIRKRIITFFSLLLTVIMLLVAFLYFSGNYRNPLHKVSPFEAVPNTTSILFDIKKVKNCLNKLSSKKYTPVLKDLSLVQLLEKDLFLIDKILQKQPILQNYVQESRMIVALQNTNSEEVDGLYILENQLTPIDLLTFENSVTGLTIEKSRFKNRLLYRMNINEAEGLTVCLDNNLLLISRQSFLVEFGIDQLDDYASNITKNRAFSNVLELTGENTDVSLYVNFKQLPLFLSYFIAEPQHKKVENLANLGNWLGLDLIFKEEGFDLNGYLAPKFDNLFLKAIQQEPLPDSSTILQLLPDNTAFALSANAKDMVHLMEQLPENSIFNTYFLPWLGNEWAYVVQEPSKVGFKEDCFWLVKTKNAEQTKQLLQQCATDNGALPADFFPPFEIKGLVTDDFLKPVFGEYMEGLKNPYYTVLNDQYVLFGSSIKGMNRWLEKYLFEQTLAQNINYQQFKKLTSRTANLQVYLNSAYFFNILKTFSRPSKLNWLEKEFRLYPKIKPVKIQLTPYNELFFVNIQAAFDEKGKQPTSVVWRRDLGAKAIMPPVKVINHNDETLEVFVQNENNTVFLLDRNGEVLMQKRVSGPIISDVFQIDYYQNKKLQYLFNTKEEIYLIDRTGEVVEGYPRRFPTPAVNGIFVADYDSTRDYRIFVACEDGNIYGFQKNGQPLNGWSPQEGIGRVSMPLQHFVVDEKDYIVAINEEGKVYFFERNGSLRQPPIALEINDTELVKYFGVDLNDEKFRRVVTANTSGKAYVVNLEGIQFGLNLSVGNNRSVKFALADVLGDHRKDYLVLSNDNLAVYYYDKSGDFRVGLVHRFKDRQRELFELPSKYGNKAYIGVVGRSKVYLIDEKGELLPDFPLAGNSRFVIDDFFENGQEVLVVNYDNFVYAYKISKGRR